MWNWQLSSFPGQHPQLLLQLAPVQTNALLLLNLKQILSPFSIVTPTFSRAATHTQQLLQTRRRRGATSDWGAECALAALNGKCWAGFCDLYLGIRDKILVPVGITTLFANAIHCEDINSLVHRSEYWEKEKRGERASDTRTQRDSARRSSPIEINIWTRRLFHPVCTTVVYKISSRGIAFLDLCFPTKRKKELSLRGCHKKNSFFRSKHIAPLQNDEQNFHIFSLALKNKTNENI
jgi:hypothetical protein